MASPIVAGSAVFPVASISAGFWQTGKPTFGVCETVVAPEGPVTVAWEDGSRETYVSSVGLLQALTPVTASLVGYFGGFSAAAPLPNPGQRSDGYVIAHLLTAAPDGTAEAEYVLLQTTRGVSAIPADLFEVDPSV